MAIDTNVQEFTNAELLKLYRLCFAHISANQSYSMNGRVYQRADIGEVIKAIEWLEEQIETAATETGGNIALAKFGDAV